MKTSDHPQSADSTGPDEIDAPLLALREMQRIRSMLMICMLMGMVIACFFARDVLLPIILGLMLALTLSPVVRGAQRAGVPPPLTAVVLIVSLGGVLSVGGYAASYPISDWMEAAPELGQQVRERLDGIFRSVEKVKEASDQVEDIAQQGEDGAVQRVVMDQPGLINSAATYAMSIGASMLVALVLALFVLASGDFFYVRLVEAYPRMSEKKRALKIVYGVERAISHYLFTITLINAGLGVVVFLLMWWVGLPNAFVWGLLAFGMNFLPFIGAIFGVVLAGLYAIISIEPLGQALLAPALYLAATSLEGQIITPAVLGRSLKLNTVSVFVTVVFWGWLWGVPGALMAVPFLVIVKVVCDNVDSLKTLGSFLGSADTTVAEKRAQSAESA